jgi:pyridoxine 5-phosphate synthase
MDDATMQIEFEKVVATGKAAAKVRIDLNAGHDLTRENLPRLVAALPNLKEVSIGHAIIADAMMLGLEKTVHLFRAAIGD